MHTDEHLIQIGVKRFGDQQKCLIALRAVPKSNWGVGNCWEHLEDGMCMCCGGAHPKLQLRILDVDEQGTCARVIEGSNVPVWQRALQNAGFVRVGLSSHFEHDALPVKEAWRVLARSVGSRGVDRPSNLCLKLYQLLGKTH